MNQHQIEQIIHTITTIEEELDETREPLEHLINNHLQIRTALRDPSLSPAFYLRKHHDTDWDDVRLELLGSGNGVCLRTEYCVKHEVYENVVMTITSEQLSMTESEIEITVRERIAMKEAEIQAAVDAAANRRARTSAERTEYERLKALYGDES